MRVQPGLQNRAVVRTRSFNTQRVVSDNVSKQLACWFMCVSAFNDWSCACATWIAEQSSSSNKEFQHATSSLEQCIKSSRLLVHVCFSMQRVFSNNVSKPCMLVQVCCASHTSATCVLLLLFFFSSSSSSHSSSSSRQTDRQIDRQIDLQTVFLVLS